MITTLIVEDDPIIAEVNAGYVGRVPGFTLAGVARTGAEAIALTAAQPTDLVLLDFGLPDLTGIQVCRALQAGHPQPPGIIAVTAARDADTVRAAIAHGVVQYLIKPYSFMTFRDKLDRYASYRLRLPSGQLTDQPEVDRALETLRGSPDGILPKGLSETTYTMIVRALREAAAPLSASEAATTTGISRVSARRYLDHLHQKGLVTLTSRYGTTGRPEHRYAWSDRPA